MNKGSTEIVLHGISKMRVNLFSRSDKCPLYRVTQQETMVIYGSFLVAVALAS